MTFSIAKVRDRVQPATVEVAGQPLALVYRPGSVASAMMAALDLEAATYDSDAAKVRAQLQYTTDFLTTVVVSWDIAEDDDSEHLPVSRETVDALGPEVAGAILAAVVEDYQERPKG